jgi:polyisoprenoid-binding protein YceI
MNCCAAALLLLTTTAAVAGNVWETIPDGSRLSFTGNLSQKDFTGVFEHFRADITFDQAHLQESTFVVTIDLSSVNTQDPDRDDNLKGAEFFWVSRYPQARYTTTSIVATDAGRFAATGKLLLRNVEHDVPIQFTFDAAGSTALLKGSATLSRLDFGVGRGEWQSTQWLADQVAVQFELHLRRTGRNAHEKATVR